MNTLHICMALLILQFVVSKKAIVLTTKQKGLESCAVYFFIIIIFFLLERKSCLWSLSAGCYLNTPLLH